MSAHPRLVIIGLDCAEPSLVFERWHDDLPNLAALMSRGSYGLLESCIPAITVPARSCMASGRDPGELGIYGFRNRVDRTYQRMAVADGRAVHFPRLWDILSEADWNVAVLGVAPDLIDYFGDLAWRAIGTVGGGKLYTIENDIGPDDANHVQYGMFIFYDPQYPEHGRKIEGAQIYDILPSLLARYAIQAPAKLRGKVLWKA